MGVVPEHKKCVSNGEQALRGCKLWPMKNKLCIGEETCPYGLHGSFKIMKGLEFLLKFSFRWLFRFPKAPLCIQTLSVCSPAPHKRHRQKIKIQDYIFIYTCTCCLSRSSVYNKHCSWNRVGYYNPFHSMRVFHTSFSWRFFIEV